MAPFNFAYILYFYGCLEFFGGIFGFIFQGKIFEREVECLKVRRVRGKKYFSDGSFLLTNWF